MRCACLLVLFLTMPVRAWAQEPPPPVDDTALRALVQDAGTAEANGGADLVTVFKRTRVDVEDSGLSHVVNHEVLKVLTEKGAADLARLRLDYDPASNEVEIRQVRILEQEGGIVSVSTSTLVDLPQPQNAIYWGARMKRWTPRLNSSKTVP